MNIKIKSLLFNSLISFLHVTSSLDVFFVAMMRKCSKNTALGCKVLFVVFLHPESGLCFKVVL